MYSRRIDFDWLSMILSFINCKTKKKGSESDFKDIVSLYRLVWTLLFFYI